MECAYMRPFVDGGSMSGPSFWTANPSVPNQCMITYTETEYSKWRPMDYKRCVLDLEPVNYGPDADDSDNMEAFVANA